MSTTFITASGTGVGKTFVTCALIRQLRLRGDAVHALKPVVTGFDPRDPAASDSGRLLQAMGLPIDRANLDRVSPWRFAAALSPDMAAAREQRSIPFADLVDYCRDGVSADLTLLEGIGGVLVPLDHEHTVADWIRALDSPTVLVTGSYLGTISHTLAAVEALTRRGIAVRGIVISESSDQPVAATETKAVIERFSRGIPCCVVSRLESPDGAPDLLHLLG